MTSDNPVKRVIESNFIRRFGLMTLTVFMYEALLGTIIKVVILDQLFPSWSLSPLLAVFYSFTLIIIWSGLLILWEKINFKWSWEWIGSQLLQKISKRRLTRSNIKNNLYDKQVLG